MHSFRGYLRDLLGAFVQLDRTGPEACQGWLVHVLTDYVTLRSPEGTDLHLPLHHIRSATRLSPVTPCREPMPQGPPPATFAQLLELSRGHHVRLYHSGPELTSGILREFGDHHLLLEVEPDQVVCFALFHVRSLYIYDREPSQGR